MVVIAEAPACASASAQLDLAAAVVVVVVVVVAVAAVVAVVGAPQQAGDRESRAVPFSVRAIACSEDR